MKISIPGLGGRLQRARKDARISQTKVAEMIGVSWMTVHRWERSQRMILDDTLEQLCEIYNKPFRWFIKLEEGDLDKGFSPVDPQGARDSGPAAARRLSNTIAAAPDSNRPMIEKVVEDLLDGFKRRS